MGAAVATFLAMMGIWYHRCVVLKEEVFTDGAICPVAFDVSNFIVFLLLTFTPMLFFMATRLMMVFGGIMVVRWSFALSSWR